MQYEEIIKKLESLSNPKNVVGMARFGIISKNVFGICMPDLRALAKKAGQDPAFAPADAKAMAGKKATAGRHKLAGQLWRSGIYEARILAGMIDEVEKVTEAQMDSWVKDFDSWAVCDGTCMNLFDKTPLAFKKAIEWAGRKPEYEKRAGFALMACLGWHDKTASAEKFKKFFQLIKTNSSDERNYVKKAVNWALRQIGKRNKDLNKEAIKVAREIIKIDNKAAKWIAGDAIRELTSPAVQKRLK
jgi:3-methyladenine DNA glycosylase AlkD